MFSVVKGLHQHRELVYTLAWKSIALRYKQAYLGIIWVILKPLMLMLIFTLVRSFVGIESGGIPYPALVMAALVPWTFFQESVSDGVGSVVRNAPLIRKIYFPREIFPVTSVLTKLVELFVNLLILAALILWYDITVGSQACWLPVVFFYTMLASLTVSFAGAALNVYYRDVSQALPVVISLMMYLSPIIYPLKLVQDKLLVQRAAGDWSEALYFLYTVNPLAGIIDSTQNVALRNLPPNWQDLWPGAVLVAILLPLSYLYFKRAERFFSDVI